jgi:rhamnose transport system ATP-binding protein
MEAAAATAAQEHGTDSVLLQASGIVKAFGGVRALRGASLEVRRGEVHALLGENGSGKSTLANIVAGRLQPDAGEMLLAGQPLAPKTPHDARGRGVALVTQDLRLAPDLSVAENVFLGDWLGRGAGVDWAAMRSRATAVLARLGLEVDVDRKVATLSQDERQLVDIGRALATEPDLLLMDEPTSALTAEQVERLFAVMRELRDDGVGIVFVSHRMAEVLAIGDRATVLRDGENAGRVAVEPGIEGEIIRLMVGRSLQSFFYKREVPIGEPVLEIKNLRRGILDDISLTVRRGEVVGLAGLSGAGRSALARTIMGLRTPEAGEILVGGKALKPGSPKAAIGAGVALVPEDRKREGLMLGASILDNVSLTAVGRGRSMEWVSARSEAEIAGGYLDKLQIKAPGVRTLTGALSGGNQQKVVLAKWLRTEPRLLILDEPTQGIDIGAKIELYHLIADLLEEGMAVLLISSDLPELMALSDRIAAMYRGRIAGQIRRAEADEERIARLIVGSDTE